MDKTLITKLNQRARTNSYPYLAGIIGEMDSALEKLTRADKLGSVRKKDRNSVRDAMTALRDGIVACTILLFTDDNGECTIGEDELTLLARI